MDAKCWMESAPPEPTALACELPAEVKAAKLRHQCTWEEAAYHVGVAHGMTASEVSTLCSRVRVYVEFQRRREARRMTESELAVFRSLLGWKPHTAAWRVFEGYMRDRVGETFMGSIAGVAAFGAFVALDDVYVEGLVHISDMGKDYYKYDAARHELLGERTKQRYRLGDRLRVKIARVDLGAARIDFVLAN